MDSGASFAGTCLTQTIMFTGFSYLLRLLKGRCRLPGDNRLLAGPAFENQRGVGAAKSEGVRERVFYRRLARFVGNIVEIASRVGGLLIDGRRQNLVAQR